MACRCRHRLHSLPKFSRLFTLVSSFGQVVSPLNSLSPLESCEILMEDSVTILDLAMPKKSKRTKEIFPHIADPEIVREAMRSARRPWENLINCGVPRNILNNFIVRIILYQGIKNRRDWDEPRSMKWYTLKRFPRRIETIAIDIERLNNDPIIGPLHVLVSARTKGPGGRNLIEEMRDMDGRRRQALAHELNAIPEHLRLYAAYLRRITKEVGSLRHHRPYNPIHHRLVAIVEEVRLITGSFMYEDLANLATCAISATKEGAREIVDRKWLEGLYKNNPHLRS